MDENEGKHPGGRPTVMTDEALAKLEDAFAYGATDRQACFYAGIDPATLYRYQNEHPEFCERKEALKEQPVMAARKAVVDALRTDPALAFKYLERKQKDEFGVRTEIVGANGDPLIPEGGDALKESVDELKRAVNAAIRQAESNPDLAADAGTSETDG